MSEMEDKNRETRINQQKGKFIRNILILVTILAVFALAFWLIIRNAEGTEITLNEFRTQLAGENIKEIDINQSKIQIYYVNGEAHWIYNRNSAESTIIGLVNGLFDQMNDAENPYKGAIPKVVFGKPTTVSIVSILFPVLMLVVLGVMVFMVLKQIKGTNNKNFDFVKSRARIYPSKTKFSDVAGEDEEKAELEDVVDFLKNPKKYIDLGAKIPKGVLLVGPPGTGKTLLARAVAGEANVPFFTISGSDFMELFVGVGASRVRDLFENAKKAKPCIIFIDEIDAVGRQRGAGMGGGNDEREQTLNQLLVQMDGFEDNEGIIVMAATNRVDILDPALLRPGRFDRRVNISVPDIKGREEILKVHSRNKPLSSEVDLKTIARITSGFTGAEIENLLNEAAILVAKDNRTVITEEDIQKSIMKVTLGPQKRSRVIEEKDKYDTAIHESGHALISKLAKEKSPVHEVSIIPRGGAGGYTLSTDDDMTVYFKDKLLCKIQMLLGGITAEKLYVGDISTGASNDLKRASSIARRMVSEWGMSSEVGMVYCGGESELFLGRDYQERMPYSENQAALIDLEVKKIIDMCQKETEKLLKQHKSKLLTMADVLLEKETIYAEEVDMIIAGKSKAEVIKYIDNKDKKPAKNEQKSENNEKSQNNPAQIDIENASGKTDSESESTDIDSLIDDLLKIAEQREQNQTQKAEPKMVQAATIKEANTETEPDKESKTKQKTTKTSSTGSKKSSSAKITDNEGKAGAKGSKASDTKTKSASKSASSTSTAKKSSTSKSTVKKTENKDEQK